jgi:hypothetical protein
MKLHKFVYYAEAQIELAPEEIDLIVRCAGSHYETAIRFQQFMKDWQNLSMEETPDGTQRKAIMVQASFDQLDKVGVALTHEFPDESPEEMQKRKSLRWRVRRIRTQLEEMAALADRSIKEYGQARRDAKKK